MIYKLVSIFILVCVCLIGVALSLVNTDIVHFNYYFNEVDIPLSLLLVFSFIGGVVVSLILIIPTMIKLRFFSAKKEKKDKDSVEKLALINPAEQP